MVLGHSVDEIAVIAECSSAAAASRRFSGGGLRCGCSLEDPEDTRLPLMSDADRRKITACVDLFQSGDFDTIRAMLAG